LLAILAQSTAIIAMTILGAENIAILVAMLFSRKYYETIGKTKKNYWLSIETIGRQYCTHNKSKVNHFCCSIV